MSDEAKNRVRKWLEENGQVLELRVSRDLIQAGIPVESSVMYVDPTTRKRRETDLVIDLTDPHVAGRSSRASSLLAVIECKHSAQGPWVGVRYANSTPDATWSFGDSDNVAFGQGLRDYLTDLPHGAIFSTSNNKNLAYDAVRQALSAAQALGEDRLPQSEDLDTLQTTSGGTCLAFVVTTAPLFSSCLNGNGELDVQATERIDVFVEDARDRRRCVTVFSPDGFTKWAPQLLQM